jgi:two-component system CheB/CheR fusion protein
MAAKKKASDRRAGKAGTPSRGSAPSPADVRAGETDAGKKPHGRKAESKSAHVADSERDLWHEIDRAELPSSAESSGPAAPPVSPPDVTNALRDAVEPSLPGLSRPRFPVVGIGASAGGLEALQEFFGRVPADSGMAFVVVTHQHPGHVSLLPTLLGKATSLSVVEAREGVAVEPNHVYVGPPGGILSILGGVLRWVKADVTKFPHLPIDHFFRSLAFDQREHAICVVLSGTGTDGTLGMRAIKAESGLAVVQETSSAKYSGMPTSASGTGLADYVLPASAMAEQLLAYTRGPYLKPRLHAAEEPAFPPEPLQRIMMLLRSRTGHDFSLYKKATILRRIQRRMNVHHIKEPNGYVQYLQQNVRELDLLFSEMLISVTSFFRDPQAFEALSERVIPELMQSRRDEIALRAWVAGCATGEEAYSLAMVMRECMDKLNKRFEVQIFATDLDAHAIDAARVGLYPGGISADVSTERLDRYFAVEDGMFRVRKEVREMIVFATQNVIKDPPFTRLDLMLCRNLLIYLDVELQRQLLPIMHYALRPRGVLLLGPSESISGFGELFEPIDSKWKIFRRKETSSNLRPVLDLPTESAKPQDEAVPPRGPLPAVKQSHTITQIERLLMMLFTPVCIVCDEHGNIVYIHGRSGAYLEPAEGQPRNNLMEMARQGLVRPLTAAMRQAVADNKEVVRERVRVKTNGDFTYVRFSVTPIAGPEPIRGLLLVTIQPSVVPQPATVVPSAKSDEIPAARVNDLEEELRFVKESLQATIEELETSNEELKSTNEELQSTNEELQSTNEELETSKEEMQSLNEELSTVNAELQAKVDELSHSTDDMQNLLNSTQVATVFLDSKLALKRYTDQARELINLIPTDIGRPLSDLTSKFDYPRLMDDCRDVIRTLVRKELELCDRDGVWHLLRIMPYRTAENVIDGVVLTFVEINRLKVAERRALGVSRSFTDILHVSREPMLLLDAQQRIVAANDSFYSSFRVTQGQAAGKPIYELDFVRSEHTRLQESLNEIILYKRDISDMPLQCDLPDHPRTRLLLNARLFQHASSPPDGTIVISLHVLSSEP